MRLKQLIKSLYNCDYSHLEDFEVRGITCNSKEVLENFIFVAIKGSKTDGHQFIEEAINKGAKAVIIQRQSAKVSKCQNSVNLIKVDDTRSALAKLAIEFYGNPSQNLKVVGITGTNGKTTVSYLIEAILIEAGFTPAVIGTVNYRFKDKVILSKNTTPPATQIQAMLSDMLKENINYAIMEVSSHALDQDRTAGINFHSAIFTNLTHDHLDYHHTLEDYFQAKAKLFKNLDTSSFAIINEDDEYGRRLKKLTRAKIITYGIKNQADIVARNIKSDIRHTEFSLTTIDGKINFKSRLIGYHNAYNILAAVSWAKTEGLDLSVIKSTLEKFYFVPGRLERIDFDGDFSIFVDYAHTEDALCNVIRSLRALTSNKIIVVFGCGGERDKTKRPKMGYIVSELADFALITNDNPRSEDPQDIIEDIKKGIKKENFCVMLDRKEAIKKSLSLAKSGDIVLIAGKGHENYQILKDRIIDFDDRKVVRECLKLMNY